MKFLKNLMTCLTDWLCPLCGARMKKARGLLDDRHWDYRAWGRDT